MTDPPPAIRSAFDAASEITLTPAGDQPPLRADAARNRQRLLEVAAELSTEHGAANVTMEAVATAAGVGKGTVFRRFGDRAGLMVALLDHHEQQIQGAFLMGPPPLGPGAPALDRLRAFGPAVIRHEHAFRDLYVAVAAHPRRRFNPSYHVKHTHITLLLRESGAAGDIELVAHTLLGYLNTTLDDYLISSRGMSVERLTAGWHDLVTRLADGE
ncbi:MULTISPECIES: TetR/AcrR family transcriptional regulator [unclassified Streptomyces]|uniref:TetR/AcrR family transcriptional regulator n=1 Tax=unclassified Streptomyces TaxID=2593676 RepID=UPI00381B782B